MKNLLVAGILALVLMIITRHPGSVASPAGCTTEYLFAIEIMGASQRVGNHRDYDTNNGFFTLRSTLNGDIPIRIGVKLQCPDMDKSLQRKAI